VLDSFRTTNEFYGAQIGAVLEGHRNQLYADFRCTLALGDMHQTVNIAGASHVTPPTPTGVSTLVGGLLAQKTNIGSHSRDEFGIVPEIGLNVGWQFNGHLRAHIGYSILYCRSDVLRPGAQIDRAVTPELVPTLSTGLIPPGPTSRPAFGFRDQDFWAQGINAGVEFSF
jgi:hypothetical protein